MGWLKSIMWGEIPGREGVFTTSIQKIYKERIFEDFMKIKDISTRKTLRYIGTKALIIGVSAYIGLGLASAVNILRDDVDFTEGTFRNFNVRAGMSRQGHRNVVLESDFPIDSYTHGVDFNGDNTFDDIRLKDIPRGHQLEDYANSDSLNLAYKTIMGS